jgi:hypothetical protein
VVAQAGVLRSERRNAVEARSAARIGREAPAVRATRKRRIELGAVLAGVERAISAPAPRRLREWVGEVIGQLERLRDAFVRHVEVTEGPGGLHEEILDAAPRLAAMVDRLKDEHVSINQGIGGRLKELRELGGREGVEVEPLHVVDRARRDILALLGRIARHRQRGADLIYEAFEVDIGGG